MIHSAKRGPAAPAVQVSTAAGAAAVRLERPAGAPVALVVLGHGAGGDTAAPLLAEVASELRAAGVAVARFDQPYRVAGRRAPAPAPQLDQAAADVVGWLRRRRDLARVPVLLGGKSSGARVACRVAAGVGAAGVVALGFPLRPPGRPHVTRAGELAGCVVPVLVCQGERDAFGSPSDIEAAVADAGHVTVHPVAGGDHSFVSRRVDGRSTADCVAEVARTVREWVLGQVAAT